MREERGAIQGEEVGEIVGIVVEVITGEGRTVRVLVWGVSEEVTRLRILVVAKENIVSLNLTCREM
jgi:hypothetical protein